MRISTGCWSTGGPRATRVAYEGKQALTGTETHKLKVTTKAGAVRYIYLDTTTYLDRRHTGVLNLAPDRQMDFVMDFGGWRRVDGVMFPFDIGEDRTGREPSVSYATLHRQDRAQPPNGRLALCDANRPGRAAWAMRPARFARR